MARGRQVVRQWMVLQALERARRGLSVEEITELVEDDCTSRTIYRDLEQLKETGFPIIDEEGRWRMLRSGEGAWSIPIHPTEVLSLMLSETILEPIKGTVMHEPLVQLRARLSAMLTPTGRQWCDIARQTAIATLFAPGDYQEHSAEIEAIDEAINKQQCLQIHYGAPNRPVEVRVVEPYLNWFHNGRLYLVGFCRKANDFRTFAIHRVRTAEVVDEPFTPRPEFDAAAFARKGFGVLHGATHRIIVDYTPAVAYLLRERRFHHTQRLTELEGGGVRLEMECAGLPEIAAWICGFGGEAIVQAPPELRDMVRQKLRAGADRYEAGGV